MHIGLGSNVRRVRRSYFEVVVFVPIASEYITSSSVCTIHCVSVDSLTYLRQLHINLIYPFLSEPTTKVDDITRRIRSVLSGFYPFRIVFEEVRHFQHSRHSSTVYLLPSDRDRDTIDRSTKSAGGEHTKAPNTGGLQAIKALQANLQTEFAECDADPRLFTLHLSVGQSKAHQDVAMFEEEVRLVMTQFCAGKEYEDVLDTGLFHPKAEAETAKARPPADEEMSSVGGHGVGTWELEWNVDRVVMIERAGHEDPFRAVAEVELLKEQQLSQGLCIASPVRPVLENVAGQELSKTLSGMALRLLYSRPQYGRKPPG